MLQASMGHAVLTAHSGRGQVGLSELTSRGVSSSFVMLARQKLENLRARRRGAPPVGRLRGHEQRCPP